MIRLDKYLWAVRLFKTRSQSADFCNKGKVVLNEILAKPSTKVKENDVIQIKKSGVLFTYKVIEILEKRVGAKLVPQYLLDITASEELEKFKIQKLMKSEYRKKGSGRPTKKDRRDIDGFNLDF